MELIFTVVVSYLTLVLPDWLLTESTEQWKWLFDVILEINEV